MWLESAKRARLASAENIDLGYDADAMTVGPKVCQFRSEPDRDENRLKESKAGGSNGLVVEIG
jgi:hypothetical protein